MYALIDSGVCKRVGATVALIPSDPTLPEWQEYLSWLAGGNTPDPAPQPVRQVPQIVSRFQGRQALREAGQFDLVRGYIDRPDTPQIVKDAWNEVQQFERESLVIMTAAIVLGLSQTQVDALFVAADKIKV